MAIIGEIQEASLPIREASAPGPVIYGEPRKILRGPAPELPLGRRAHALVTVSAQKRAACRNN